MTETGHRYRDLLLISGLILAITLPFSGRAFHLDDNLFLRLAQIIQRHPFNPYAETPEKGFVYAGLMKVPAPVDAPAPATPNYWNELPEPVLKKLKAGTLGFESAVHPPLLPYYIALVSYLSGGLGERSQHIAYQLFSLIAAFTAYALARRFTRFPLWTTLFFVASCVFVMGAQSLMSDMPMVASYQAAVWFFVRGIDRADYRRLFASGVFIALAFLTRYSAATLIPVLLAYALLKRAPLAQTLLPFALFIGLYGAWETPNILRFGRPHLLASSSVAYEASANSETAVAESAAAKMRNALRNWLERGMGSLVYIGGTMVFSLALILAFVRSRAQGATFLALLVGFQAAVFLNAAQLFPDYSFIQSFFVALFAATGLFVPGLLVARRLQELRPDVRSVRRPQPDDGFLLLWFLIVWGATVFALPFAAARYLFPLVFPLVALFVNQATAAFSDGRRRAQLFAAGFGLMLLLSVNLAFADYQQAEIYRSFIRTHLPAYQARAAHVWYIAEWGFRHYAEEAGCLFLPPEVHAPTEGDLIIMPRENTPHPPAEALMARVKLVESIPYYNPSPWRLLDHATHAGFYSHGWGYLPFSLSRAPTEQFDVYAVTGDDFFVRTFPKAQRELAEGAVAEVQSVEIDGVPTPVIWETPPARITYRLSVPRDKWLSFRIGLAPEVWSPDKGDGVLFELQIAQVSAAGPAAPQTLLSKYIDPKNNVADRKWHPVLIDLSPYAGKEVALTFITRPGPQNDASEDWAGWADPKFISPPARSGAGPP